MGFLLETTHLTYPSQVKESGTLILLVTHSFPGHKAKNSQPVHLHLVVCYSWAEPGPWPGISGSKWKPMHGTVLPAIVRAVTS